MKRKCFKNFRKHSPSAAWPIRKKWRRWPCFCVPMKRLSSPVRIIRSTADFSISTDEPGEFVSRWKMRIDSHQHFWQYNAVRHSWITEEMSLLKRDFMPEDLDDDRKAGNIDATIAVQADQSEEETLFLLQLAQRHSSIAGVVGWVDLCSPHAAKRLKHFSQFDKLRGFRHLAQDEPDERFLARADFLRGIACLREFGFTYDILVYPEQLPAALELVAHFPEQKFVIDHIEARNQSAQPLRLGRAHAKYRREAQRLLQGFWPRHRSRLEKLEERRFSALLGYSIRCVWPEAPDVRLGLARVPARRRLSAGARNHRKLRSGLRGGHQGQNLRGQCSGFLSVESGETWTCSLKTRSSLLPAAGRELARPSYAALRAKAPSPSSWTKTWKPPISSKKTFATPARNAASSSRTSFRPKTVPPSSSRRSANLAGSMSSSTTSE